ncbi:hypothetical protein [Micromonospora sp. WMMD1274]|uniref:hypothetical protein n=1 Tax=Micromonospora sp. WMMD1274 TaxID=3404116 RepID=UPI003B94BD5A
MAQEEQGREALPATELEIESADRQTVRRLTEQLMTALEGFVKAGVTTPGRASWLHIHHIPVRRLLGQVVRKLLELHSHTPIAVPPELTRSAVDEGLITTRAGNAREYVYYTISWSGLAYILGAPTRRDPLQEPHPLKLATAAARQTSSRLTEPGNEKAEVVALTWSSRHADTLLPVLAELRRLGQSTMLLDLATDPAQQILPSGMPVHRGPTTLLQLDGGIPYLISDRADSVNQYLVTAGHPVCLGRLERLAATLVQMSAGCTQPSWLATVAIESWLTNLLTSAKAQVLMVADDIGPLGALAVHVAERLSVATTNVQHGAWTADAISRPALHARIQIVTGDRDAVLARSWVRHPAAEIHVLGQPRFDTLKAIDRGRQRRYLLQLLQSAGHARVDHVIVLACQPAMPQRINRHIALLVDGLRKAQERWGLVLAPHPAQEPALLQNLIRPAQVPVVLADAQVGARGCLGGADALASVSSTCGVEAMLLGLPVLEIITGDEPTLGLADHGAALACRTSDDINAALNTITRSRHETPVRVKDAVCRWRGTTARDIADLILRIVDSERPDAS